MKKVREKEVFEQIDSIFPSIKVTLVCKEEVLVMPVPLPRISEFYSGVLAILTALEKMNYKLEDVADLPQVFTLATKESIGIMSIALNKPLDWFNRITLSDGLKLLDAILKINTIDDVVKNAKSLVATLKTFNLI